MEKGKKIILKGEIESQIKEIERIYTKIDERSKVNSKYELEGLSLWLHHLYCSFEDLFNIIARTFENHVDDMSRFHVELLKRMTIAIDGIRPAFLSRTSYEHLDNLRSFRHVLRHAYVFDLDERRVLLVLEDAKKLEKKYKNEIQEFLDQL